MDVGGLHAWDTSCCQLIQGTAYFCCLTTWCIWPSQLQTQILLSNDCSISFSNTVSHACCLCKRTMHEKPGNVFRISRDQQEARLKFPMCTVNYMVAAQPRQMFHHVLSHTDSRDPFQLPPGMDGTALVKPQLANVAALHHSIRLTLAMFYICTSYYLYYPCHCQHFG